MRCHMGKVPLGNGDCFSALIRSSLWCSHCGIFRTPSSKNQGLTLASVVTYAVTVDHFTAVPLALSTSSMILSFDSLTLVTPFWSYETSLYCGNVDSLYRGSVASLYRGYANSLYWGYVASLYWGYGVPSPGLWGPFHGDCVTSPLYTLARDFWEIILQFYIAYLKLLSFPMAYLKLHTWEDIEGERSSPYGPPLVLSSRTGVEKKGTTNL